MPRAKGLRRPAQQVHRVVARQPHRRRRAGGPRPAGVRRRTVVLDHLRPRTGRQVILVRVDVTPLVLGRQQIAQFIEILVAVVLRRTSTRAGAVLCGRHLRHGGRLQHHLRTVGVPT